MSNVSKIASMSLAVLAGGTIALQGCAGSVPDVRPVEAVVTPSPEAEPGPVDAHAAAAPVLQVAEDAPHVPYRCAGGSLFVADDRPYCVAAAASSFAASKRWCDDNGGALMTVESAPQMQALMRAFASPRGLDRSMWIGLVEVRAGAWRWSTGRPVQSVAWAPGEPNNAGEEHCGEMVPSTAGWNDLACTTSLPFLCEARGRRGAPGKLACTGAAFVVGATTYCFDEARTASWGDAEAACKLMGGTLASFETAGEIEAFRAATASPLGSDRAWLGITDEGREGRWVDDRGLGVDFQRWRPGEPNDAGGEDCAEWYPADGGWNDIACESPHVGICIPR